MKDIALDDDLLERIHSAVRPGDVIYTLTSKSPNVIAAIDRDGIWVRTQRSDSRGTGPRLVPAWMILAGWKHLRQAGSLSQAQLLNGLNVKRSAFVMALLAQFSDVNTRSTRPTVIELMGSSEQ